MKLSKRKGLWKIKEYDKKINQYFIQTKQLQEIKSSCTQYFQNIQKVHKPFYHVWFNYIAKYLQVLK